MNKTVILKVITGEELIATKVGDNTYEKVRVFARGHDETGNPTVGLVPFITLNQDAKIDINKNLIYCELDCPDAVEKSYFQVVSGLVIARG